MFVHCFLSMQRTNALGIQKPKREAMRRFDTELERSVRYWPTGFSPTLRCADSSQATSSLAV
eukprot:12272679-Prorocentrum_lima.AAC.1